MELFSILKEALNHPLTTLLSRNCRDEQHGLAAHLLSEVPQVIFTDAIRSHWLMQSIQVSGSVGQRDRMWATCVLLHSLGATLKEVKKKLQGKLILIIHFILPNISKTLRYNQYKNINNIFHGFFSYQAFETCYGCYTYSCILSAQ